MNRDAEIRRILNIHYCPSARCRQDTMPLDRTGCCAFCDRQLCEPVRHQPEPDDTDAACDNCGGAIPGDKPTLSNQRYCSERCRRRSWDLSPTGIEYRFAAAQRRVEQKRARRAAGKAG